MNMCSSRIHASYTGQSLFLQIQPDCGILLGIKGLLRIVGGSYVTEGRVEVYCNNWWGTICDDGLSNIEADTMCRQLGYSESIRYDHLIL